MSDSHLITSDGYIEYIPFAEGEYPTLGEESAGKVVAAVVGIAAVVFAPYLAPTIFGSIAASTALPAFITGAATFLGGATSAIGGVLGSAIVGGVLNAGAAYAGGARGADVWRAAGMGAIGGGIGAVGRAMTGPQVYGAGGSIAAAQGGGASAGLSATTTLSDTGTLIAPTSAPAPTGVPELGGLDFAAGAGAGAGAGTPSPGLLSQVTATAGRMGVNPNTLMNAVTMAAQGLMQSSGMDELVAARRAELASLTDGDRAKLGQIASDQYNLALQADPKFLSRLAAANVQVSMNAEFNRARRDINIRQQNGDGKDAFYTRTGKLAIGRAKAQAGEEGYARGLSIQGGLLANAATSYAGLHSAGIARHNAGDDTAAAEAQARNASTAGLAGLLGGGVGWGSNSTYNDGDQDQTPTNDDDWDPRT